MGEAKRRREKAKKDAGGRPAINILIYDEFDGLAFTEDHPDTHYRNIIIRNWLAIYDGRPPVLGNVSAHRTPEIPSVGYDDPDLQRAFDDIQQTHFTKFFASVRRDPDDRRPLVRYVFGNILPKDVVFNRSMTWAEFERMALDEARHWAALGGEVN